MTHQELVSLLRSRARRSGAQTSHYRGVSLLKQTRRWHAQINAGGRQVHLGFFGTEEQAARAYDRCAARLAAAARQGRGQARGGGQGAPQCNTRTPCRLAGGVVGGTAAGPGPPALLASSPPPPGTPRHHHHTYALPTHPPTHPLPGRRRRASISKAAGESSGRVVTNFDLGDYVHELRVLCAINQEQLLAALADDRRAAMLCALCTAGSLVGAGGGGAAQTRGGAAARPCSCTQTRGIAQALMPPAPSRPAAHARR